MLQREHSAILSTFIKLPVGIKTFVLSTFEWPFYTGFTVNRRVMMALHHSPEFLALEALLLLSRIKSFEQLL